ncbi:MAG: hypothetical protein QCI82_01815 [Candidatus Thermoplasmatota archaeon]|nr:hypothetical protein [Candidatus Thermoplasmatota archaeon]
MDTNYYLTPSEQRILNVIDNASFIEKKALSEHLYGMNDKNLDKGLTSLSRKGEIFRLKRGFYIRTGARGIDTTLILRAAPVAYGGYIAFDTALRIYDLLDYEPFTIMVSTPYHSGSIPICQYEIVYTSMGERCRGQVNQDGIWVSDLEKTFFDCFYRPDLSGGYQNISKAIAQVKDLSWKRFGSYLQRLGTDPLRQRVGYITSKVLASRIDDEIKEFLEGLKGSVKTPTRLLPSGPTGGKSNKEWKVQDNLGINVWGEWMSGH